MYPNFVKDGQEKVVENCPNPPTVLQNIQVSLLFKGPEHRPTYRLVLLTSQNCRIPLPHGEYFIEYLSFKRFIPFTFIKNMNWLWASPSLAHNVPYRLNLNILRVHNTHTLNQIDKLALSVPISPRCTHHCLLSTKKVMSDIWISINYS